MRKSKLIFFLGGAGSGKTTLAKALSRKYKAAFLDMDILLRPAAEAIMTLQGLDPSDRDSPEYKRLCRDLGYRITMDAALDNVQLGVDTLVVGPFTKETGTPDWIEQELARIGRSLDNTDVRVAYVYLQNEALYRQRITARQSPLDEWKLANWDAFRSSLDRKRVAWPLPTESIAYIDNSSDDPAIAFAELERRMYE
ncbi:AAA domain-containing protein [Paenibacillus polysaccharolyticus]|uniref:AAA domain-containing protein n=1 Tax=Paenibacillus polysaccharolyticus TaxID=582692 RepID=A0A1G5KZN4_9BACL|nr:MULTISPECIES: AAA family ATPase [Paenibacillus]SCZ05548.1 AAA domain-containing protein [Paenibacillus polysaccharolyticus]